MRSAENAPIPLASNAITTPSLASVTVTAVEKRNVAAPRMTRGSVSHQTLVRVFKMNTTNMYTKEEIKS